MATSCCDSQCSSSDGIDPEMLLLASAKSAIPPSASSAVPASTSMQAVVPEGKNMMVISGRKKHARGDSTASTVSAGGFSPFHHQNQHHHHRAIGQHGASTRISHTNSAGDHVKSSKRGHKRTRSAGNYGFNAGRDLSLYMATGLYAAGHQQMPPYRSFEYGFNEICNSGMLSNSDTNLSTGHVCKDGECGHLTSRKSSCCSSSRQQQQQQHHHQPHRHASVSNGSCCNRSSHHHHSHHRSSQHRQLLASQKQQLSSTTSAAAGKVGDKLLLQQQETSGQLLPSSTSPGHKSSQSNEHDSGSSGDEEEEDGYSDSELPAGSGECGILSLRPRSLQKYATIQVFVLLCCLLVTLNQALSSGYFNSVITTIEKRFDIPSRMTGLIASTFEIGNLITVIFVSYFGTHRHIPVWIGKGIIVTGLGSLVFSLAHFVPQSSPLDHVNLSLSGSLLDDNICHIPESSLVSPLASARSHFLVPDGAPDQAICRDSGSYRSPHIVIFVLAMILIGCGGTPIFTLGTIYIDDHVRQEDSSMYIGCMYSMVAFGLVVGFLLGGYFITIHENSFGTGIIPADIYPGHPKWIGAWWCGFVLLGILLILIAVPFFAFPRSLRRRGTSKKKRSRKQKNNVILKVNNGDCCNSENSGSSSTRSNHHHHQRNQDKVMNLMAQSEGRGGGLLLHSGGFNQEHVVTAKESGCTILAIDLLHQQKQDPPHIMSADDGHAVTTCTITADACSQSLIKRNESFNNHEDDPEYGRSLKEIPKCMWNLLSNPVYIVTCLGSCMELSIVSGFLVFLPKYLETQFTISKSEANLFAGGIAVPGACIGIFLGGFLLKKFQLGIKGAIQFVLFFNLVCMGLYTGLYFLGCDNMRMAGTTLPYHNSSSFEVPFQVNLTSECNNRCRCPPNEIEPICGRNGITYFSPCHAGCQNAGGPRHTQNYSNCACISDAASAAGSNAASGQIAPYFQENADGVTVVPIARSGPCPQPCRAMIPFLVILFIVTLVVSITQMPLLMVTLRSVREEERAFALGMQFVIFRLFGYIPSPIVFGHVIDSTCLYWKANCGRQGGFCLIYNIEHFRLRYIGVCSGLKVAAGLLFFLDWILVCYNSSRENRKAGMDNKPLDLSVKQIVRSIISLDRLSSGDKHRGVGAVGGHDDDEDDAGDRLELLEAGHDSDYNSAIIDDIDVEDNQDAVHSAANERKDSHC